MKTEITIIRHGETQWNLEQKYQGQLDSELTQRGKTQIEKTTSLIRHKTYDIFYSSDLGRAMKSAGIVNMHLQLPLIPDDQLRERNFGIMQGLSKDAIKERYPDLYEGLNFHNVNFPVEGGESFKAFYERSIAGIIRIENQNKGKKVLIMAHGGILNCIFRFINRIPLDAPRTFSIPNGGINVISHEENSKWTIESWGTSAMEFPLSLRQA